MKLVALWQGAHYFGHSRGDARAAVVPSPISQMFFFFT